MSLWKILEAPFRPIYGLHLQLYEHLKGRDIAAFRRILKGQQLLDRDFLRNGAYVVNRDEDGNLYMEQNDSLYGRVRWVYYGDRARYEQLHGWDQRTLEGTSAKKLES